MIINLHKLVSKITGKEYRDRSSLCRNCLHICSSIEHLNTHQQYCLDKDSLQITMPDTTKNKVAFENFPARWFSPFVIYLDLESLIVPVQTVKNNQNISGTYALEQHLPCSYCLLVIEHRNPEPIYFDIYRGPDCMERFLSKIEKLARHFFIRREFPKFIGVARAKTIHTNCWICNAAFENEDEKVLDHCHFSGQFLWYAHNECNLKRRTLNYTPVIAHNMMNYDLHHIVKTLHSASENVKIDVIPTNDKKFIALNYGVYIERRKRKRDEVFVYEYLRFIVTFKFMPNSFSKLVKLCHMTNSQI